MKKYYVIVIKTFLNPKGHQNLINGSKVTAILLKGWISPVGGASAVEGLRSTGLPRLVFSKFLALTNIWALITRRKLQNPPKITLHGNCHSSAPITDTKVPRVPF